MEAVQWCWAGSPSLGKLVITGGGNVDAKQSEDENQEPEAVPYLYLPETTSILWDDNSCWELLYQTAPKLGEERIEMPGSSPDDYWRLLGLAWPCRSWSTQPHLQTCNKCWSCFVSEQAGDQHEEALTACCGWVWRLHTLSTHFCLFRLTWTVSSTKQGSVTELCEYWEKIFFVVLFLKIAFSTDWRCISKWSWLIKEEKQ